MATMGLFVLISLAVGWGYHQWIHRRRFNGSAKEAQQWMKKLLNWRKTASAVHYGKLVHFIPKDGVYVYFRYDDNQKIMVIMNKNTKPYILEVDRFSEVLEGVKTGTAVMSGQTFDMTEGIKLPEMGALILELK